MIQHADADDRNAEIARGLELIARDVAEPAGIDRQRLADGEFHAEVRDPRERRVAVRLLKPCGSTERSMARVEQLLHALAVIRSLQQVVNLARRHRLQHGPRIVRERPQLGVERSPQLVGAAVPRPAQIERDLGELSDPDVVWPAHEPHSWRATLRQGISLVHCASVRLQPPPSAL